MKYILILQICSSILGQCTEPIKTGEYNSHYDCATAGFISSLSVLREFKIDYVNKNRMLVNFSCMPEETI